MPPSRGAPRWRSRRGRGRGGAWGERRSRPRERRHPRRVNVPPASRVVRRGGWAGARAVVLGEASASSSSDAAVTVDELDITVRSWRLHAHRWGSASAPLVIGVPGLSGTSRSFGYLGSRLGGESLQLVALDLRGRGRSET